MKQGVDYIGVTIATMCFHPDGKLLVVHRTTKCRDEHNRWDIIGGGLEKGEEFAEAAQREAYEEMHVRLTDVQLIGVRNVLRTHDAVQTHWVCVMMRGTVTNPDDVAIQETEKFDGWKWTEVNDLPSPLHSQFMKQLEHYQSWLKKA
ncbi:MAG: NUDIX domain-containing protein [Candidatus Roizmanbacteria bacterium]